MMTQASILGELQHAISMGFVNHFHLQADGLLHAGSDKVYKLEELIITVITSIESRASLFLIITKVDGLKGTIVDYWEV